MKKALMAIGLVLLAAYGAFAQLSMVVGKTYYYKYVETVDPDTGMRSLNRKIGLFNVPEGVYITFTKNGCYPSDEKGLSCEYDAIGKGGEHIGGPLSYSNVETKVQTFKAEWSYSYFGLSQRKTAYLKFSDDFKRMNFSASLIYSGYTPEGEQYKQNIYVYERADPAKKEEPKPPEPVKMW